MASSSGTSSGSSLMQTSGSEEAMEDQRKRKRMMSNRESAKRSRMRKQKHFDDLTAQVAQLRKENHQITSSMNIVTQNFLTIEGENSILRAQMDELSHRLSSLNEILSLTNQRNGGAVSGNGNYSGSFADAMDGFFNPSSFLNQPIMASASDIFPY